VPEPLVPVPVLGAKPVVSHTPVFKLKSCNTFFWLRASQAVRVLGALVVGGFWSEDNPTTFHVPSGCCCFSSIA
jgi:hypothetical protein